ncbi:hypothetical protein CFBP1590__5037 [Pseudomonas viridiflava]|uniref:Uncharacterized protein n=1 Tax=Pseudomonas viridiflava TaxID=33069 RepID=A0A1Y6JWE2_PSEVI|nr:hypothetical protein [Pseudomonas viridiflava]SMS12623.1 hypothetical protein CFBP1590__5037 [Pseudomonas viridiflava]
MADLETPFTEIHLPFHLSQKNRKVRLVQRDGGYTLVVVHNDTVHLLTAQRGHVRVFKNLTLAAEYLKAKGVKKFMVYLEVAKEAAERKARKVFDWDEE